MIAVARAPERVLVRSQQCIARLQDVLLDPGFIERRLAEPQAVGAFDNRNDRHRCFGGGVHAVLACRTTFLNDAFHWLGQPCTRPVQPAPVAGFKVPDLVSQDQIFLWDGDLPIE